MQQYMRESLPHLSIADCVGEGEWNQYEFMGCLLMKLAKYR